MPLPRLSIVLLTCASCAAVAAQGATPAAGAQPFTLVCHMEGGAGSAKMLLRVEPGPGTVNGIPAAMDYGQISWAVELEGVRYRTVINRYSGAIRVYAEADATVQVNGSCELADSRK